MKHVLLSLGTCSNILSMLSPPATHFTVKSVKQDGYQFPYQATMSVNIDAVREIELNLGDRIDLKLSTFQTV